MLVIPILNCSSYATFKADSGSALLHWNTLLARRLQLSFLDFELVDARTSGRDKGHHRRYHSSAAVPLDRLSYSLLQNKAKGLLEDCKQQTTQTWIHVQGERAQLVRTFYIVASAHKSCLSCPISCAYTSDVE